MKLCRNVFFLIVLLSPFIVESIDRWAISSHPSLESLSLFPLVVLNPESKEFVVPLKGKGRIVLGRIEVGAIDGYQNFGINNLIIGNDSQYRDRYTIDIRKREWRKEILEKQIPKVLLSQFDGIYLDSLSQVLELEKENPINYKGMKRALIDLLRAIRVQYPSIKIMVNGGYRALIEISPYIDMVVGEGLYSRYDIQKEKYILVTKRENQKELIALKKVKAINPNIEIFTLDFWDPEGKEMIKKIYSGQRKQGFIPYVATNDLSTVYGEPKG